MTLARLILRSLWWYRRTGLCVVLGVAVATAVLVGSLVIGDSVKASLRELAMGRLGRTDAALLAPHLFSAHLTRALAQHGRETASLLLLRGAARHPASGVTVPQVQVVGIDADFTRFFPTGHMPALTDREVAVNRSLADDLGLRVGDPVLLTLARGGGAAPESLFAQRDRARIMRTLRLSVRAILPDRGAGGFALTGGSLTPRNLFVARGWLARGLGVEDPANAVLVAAPAGDLAALNASLQRACRPEDLGLRMARHPARNCLALESNELVLAPAQVAAAEQAAQVCGSDATRASIYLATTVQRAGGGRIAYAMLAGAERLPPFRFSAGGGTLAGDGIWLNRWAADDLGARIGEPLRVAYLVPSPSGIYRPLSRTFHLRGIVEMEGAAVDPGWIPAIEGITTAGRIDEWVAPFPIDMTRVTERDETYWDRFRATPKAFIPLEAARAMWDGQDWVTAVYLTPRAGETLAAFEARFREALRAAYPPAAAGMTFRAVRQGAQAAAEGSTDFAQLFLSMSCFIMLAGAGLAGMMMRLSVERRAREAGILRACGVGERQIARALYAEGLLLAVAGALLGVPCGLCYAWGIIAALTSWWAGAVGSAALWLHPYPATLALGGGAGIVIGALAVWWGIRDLGRRDLLALLSGWQACGTQELAHGLRAARCTAVAGIGGMSCLALGAFGLWAPQAACILGGLLLLVAVLAGSALLLRRALAWRGRLTPLRLAVRSAAVQPGRSLLMIGLLASASFIIVLVGANRRDFTRIDPTERASGTGGFTLRAVATLPLGYDVSTPEGRAKLGFSAADNAALAGCTFIPFLMSGGEDISCLNIARPQSPRVLGVLPAMVARGGFRVQTAGESRAPWALLGAEGADIPAFGDADSVLWSLHAGLGKPYSMPAGAGRATLRFSGLIQGSIFAGEILVSEARFRSLFPGRHLPRFFLIETPVGQEARVAEVLRRNLGDVGVEVRSTREMLNALHAVPNTYLAVFLALGGLGVLLGTLGLLAVMARSAVERRGEFALLQATGFRREDVATLLVYEYGGLFVAGLLAGTGCALLAGLPALRAVESQVNWGALGGLELLILATGLCCCTAAAQFVTRGHVLAALREDS